MSKDTSNTAGDGRDVKAPRTQLGALSTVGHTLSQDELAIVAGGLVLSWTDPVELAPVLREHLEAITALVGARLDNLHP